MSNFPCKFLDFGVRKQFASQQKKGLQEHIRKTAAYSIALGLVSGNFLKGKERKHPAKSKKGNTHQKARKAAYS
jgi:hypothetical protein